MGKKVSVRVSVKGRISGTEVGSAIVSYINDCGGIAKALIGFKPSSLGYVQYGREMRKLGFRSVVYRLNLTDVKQHAEDRSFPIAQVFTYLYYRGAVPVIEGQIELLPKDINVVLLDSPLKDLEALRKELSVALRRVDCVMRKWGSKV